MTDDKVIKLGDRRPKSVEQDDSMGVAFSEANSIRDARMKAAAMLGLTIDPNEIPDDKLMDAITHLNEAWAELVAVLIFRGRFF